MYFVVQDGSAPISAEKSHSTVSVTLKTDPKHIAPPAASVGYAVPKAEVSSETVASVNMETSALVESDTALPLPSQSVPAAAVPLEVKAVSRMTLIFNEYTLLTISKNNNSQVCAMCYISFSTCYLIYINAKC